jgi:hypothetical protein
MCNAHKQRNIFLKMIRREPTAVCAVVRTYKLYTARMFDHVSKMWQPLENKIIRVQGR